MPLARTPPQKGSASPVKRAHTFTPSMAYPDEAFAPRARVTRSPEGSGSPGPSTTAAFQQALQRPAAQPAPPTRETPPEAMNHPASGRTEDDEMDVEVDIGGPEVRGEVEMSSSSREREREHELMVVDEEQPAAIVSEPAPASAHVSPPLRTSTPPPAAASTTAAPPAAPPTPGRRAPRPSIARQLHAPRTPSPEPPRSRGGSAYPEAGPSTSTAAAPSTSTTTPAALPPVTPRRQSIRARERERTPIRTPAQVLAEPAVPIAGADDARYGKHYEALVTTLRNNAVDKGLGRLSFEQMCDCYPLLAEEKPETLRAVWNSMLHELRSSTLAGAYNLLDEYRVNKRLAAFAEVLDDARAWAREHPGEGRRDAWRPDLDPYVISAGTCLEVHDAAWEHLRGEYLELAGECSQLAKRVQEKQARLAAMDNGVSDSVVELAKTNALLKDFPSPAMFEWVEATESKLPTRKE